MTMKKLIFLLILCGCTTMNSYQPNLSSRPSNAGKYETDRKSCIDESNTRMRRAASDYQSSGAWILPGALGLSGAAIGSATSDNRKDYDKNGFEMIDECLTAKGYKIAN